MSAEVKPCGRLATERCDDLLCSEMGCREKSDVTDPEVLERVARDAGFLNFADAMARLIAENKKLRAAKQTASS